MKKLILIAVGAALVGLVALLATGFRQGWGGGRLEAALLSGTDPAVERVAPDFVLEQLDALELGTGGPAISLADYRGRPVVLSFWASWCLACRREHPAMMLAFERYRDRGVVFLGIIYKDTPDGARGYLKELGGGWPQLLDPGSRTAIDYGVFGVPETVFIDRSGRIAYRRIGESTYE
ncbi:MAG: TlpA family protein disulfide reductase, partial [Actinomycetota bacterium]